MIKETIQKIIYGSLKKLNLGEFDFREISVESPKVADYGDYSTNIAIIIAKNLQKNPSEIANLICVEIKKISPVVRTTGLKGRVFEGVEAAGWGFINFYLSKEFLADNVSKILKDKNFGKNKNLKNKKTESPERGRRIIIEYTDPNPFKEFHIGHLMSNSIGESLSRILEFQGAKVKRANYQGDVGLHVAKAILGKLKNPSASWQGAYTAGTAAYENNKAEINTLNKKIYERNDKQINKLYDQGKKECLKNFDKIYKILGTKFDYYFFESESADSGKKIVEKNIGEIFERGENGAIIFNGEKYGLHTRVFVNSEGLPTYEAKELALAEIKRKKFKYDKSIIVTANEVNEYFKVILSAMGLIFPGLSAKTEHIGHGMMKLPEGKMSSRTGKVVTFEFLLNEIEKLISEKIKDRDLPEKEKNTVAKKVAVGALKYSILKQSIGNDIIYSPEKSISFEGDSGPYLQYSYARAKSVLRKAQSERIKSDSNLRMHPNAPNNLERMMVYFPEIIEKASEERAPHRVATYLTELAREFNNFYAKEKIVDKNDKFSPYKVALTEAFSIIMKNGLWLLGIQTPDRM